MFLLFFPVHAFADSSWVWLTASPVNILPYAIIGTLAIEIFMIYKFNHIQKFWKVTGVVSLANVLAFAAPFLIRALFPATFGYPSAEETLSGPDAYIVMTGYLFLTLAVEVPSVYLFLRGNVSSKKRLLATIIIANVITTALVALCERLICVGAWGA